MQVLKATSDDGTALRLARWGDAKRDVLLVHGLAEHAGRYVHVADALVAAGWRVTFVELRGHGHSEGRRGHTKYWHRYVEDVQAAAATINRPFVTVAHSMGGLVALDALSEPIAPRCLALAVSNPLISVAAPQPAWKEKAARVLSKFLPWLPLPTDLDASLISHDPEVVRAYEADPLVFGNVTPRWATEMELAQARVLSNAPKATMPLLAMIGSDDRICSPEASAELAAAWGGPTQKQVYDGFYHELFNEVDKARVLADLVAWLDSLEIS
jgi:acylglycerol lipase